MFLADSPKCSDVNDVLCCIVFPQHFSVVRVFFACYDPSYLLSCEIRCLLFFTLGSKGNAGARVQRGDIYSIATQ